MNQCPHFVASFHEYPDLYLCKVSFQEYPDLYLPKFLTPLTFHFIKSLIFPYTSKASKRYLSLSSSQTKRLKAPKYFLFKLLFFLLE